MNKTDIADVHTLAQRINPPQPAVPLARFRLTLREGESYTLSPSLCEVRILSGAACILEDGREMILMRGETRAIPAVLRGSVSSGMRRWYSK